mgnify:CR=1 FL=1
MAVGSKSYSSGSTLLNIGLAVPSSSYVTKLAVVLNARERDIFGTLFGLPGKKTWQSNKINSNKKEIADTPRTPLAYCLADISFDV